MTALFLSLRADPDPLILLAFLTIGMVAFAALARWIRRAHYWVLAFATLGALFLWALGAGH